MRRLWRLLLAALLALLSLAAPVSAADTTMAQDIGARLGSQIYDAVHGAQDGVLPWQQKQGPPVQVAGLNTDGNFRDDTQSYLRTGNIVQPSFVDQLQTTLVPQIAYGDGTPTFTRATTAYQTDFAGKLNPVLAGEARFQGARRVQNWLTHSEDFSGADWFEIASGTGSVPVVTNNYGTAPDGSVTAARVQLNKGAGTTSSDYSILRALNTTGLPENQYRNTAWIKSTDGASTYIVMFYAGTDPSSKVTVTGMWQRLSVGGNTSGAVRPFDFGVRGLYGSASADVLIWHPMAENSTGQTNQNPSEYVSVGVLSAPYHGAGVDGVKYFPTLNGNTVASNVVTEAQGLPIVAGQSGVSASAPVDAKGPYGYLPEGARTNYALYSRTWTNAAWVASNVTAAQTQTGVDGVANSAASLTASAGNGTLLQSITLASQANVFQPFIKRITGTGEVDITLDGGTTWTNITSQINSSTFTQVQATETAANPQIGFRIVTSGDAIAVDMGDMQGGTFASTPIPTTTVAVTRNADVLTYPSAGNILDAAGTVYAEFSQSAMTAARIVGSTTSPKTPLTITGTGKLEIYDGTNFSITANAETLGTVNKGVASWGSQLSAVLNAGTAASSVYGGSITGTNISIGTDSANILFGTIRNVRIYPTALSAPYLQNLTADATGFLGDPMWRYAANDDYYRKVANQ